MEERCGTGFYAKLMGGFSLKYNGKFQVICKNLQGRSMQLLFILLKAGKEGIDRETFFTNSHLETKIAKKRTSNFRQQLYKLRKLIRESDLPEGRYVVLQQGRYYFTLEYELHTDTEALDQIISKISRLTSSRRGNRGRENGQEALQELYLQYCEGYGGEFLPMLSGEEWVTMEAAYYHKWYFDCLKKLSIVLKEKGQYEQLLELSTTASQLCPYDEWQVVQIECLMALDRHKEAQKIYEKASDIFCQELGTRSIERVMEQYYSGEIRDYPGIGVLANMKKELEEEERGVGGYYCNYPSFLDSYHIIDRIGEREKVKNTLLLCTLWLDGQEEKRTAVSEALKLPMKRLRYVLENGIRYGDVYTQYSENQYLAILIGANEAAGRVIAHRLENSWEESNHQEWVQVKFAVQEMENLSEAEPEEKLKQRH